MCKTNNCFWKGHPNIYQFIDVLLEKYNKIKSFGAKKSKKILGKEVFIRKIMKKYV